MNGLFSDSIIFSTCASPLARISFLFSFCSLLPFFSQISSLVSLCMCLLFFSRLPLVCLISTPVSGLMLRLLLLLLR